MTQGVIPFFEGPTAFLSNFFEEPDGTTVEHEFQAAKTFDLREKVQIFACTTPGQAKRKGHKVPLRSDWETKQANAQPLKVNVMRELVFRKFWDHGTLADQLANTGDDELVEGNRWHDQFWGNCHCESCQNITGQNWLGIVLMDVRAVLF